MEMIIGIGILVVLVGTCIGLYNGIIGKHNAVDRAWASVLTQERQKNKIIPMVEQLVEQYKLHESEVLSRVTELRSAIAQMSEGVDTDKLAATERQTKQLLQGLQVTVEAYPELKASDTYLRVMAEISEQQEQVGAAIRIFNANVEDFNNAIEMFPGSMVNNMFAHKQKLKSFTDSEAQAGFEYKPNL
ncbi:LemA family protein [Shewanella corallii]|uniref:LemA family protein n=2 Tax=Shewanella TaxID=22 RepID=A0ABT0N803_9GAMM|nr:MULTISPECIES: LemA family protein [Shewanella]MCL1038512.1 LemA family protein [Shewanella submarina]MCL2914507.1 LemA family protein [Shewanella corallii]